VIPATPVPSENTVRVAILELTMILLYHRFYDIHPFSHLHLGPEVPPRIGPRKPCASASARCPESKLQKAPPHDSRSSPLGFPVAALARLAKAAHLRPTRDCHPVAQERISVVLEMEDRPRWPGRRRVPTEVRDLIRQMSQTNPLWGAPRIHGELPKLGIEVNQATVSKYMDGWRAASSVLPTGCLSPTILLRCNC